MRRAFQFLPMALLVLLTGCGKPEFSDKEKAVIASLSLSALPPLKADTNNRFADVPAAAALGSTLFFDQQLSGEGTVSCSTCHKIDRQFQDDLPRAVGVAQSNRRTMPLANVAYNTWFFWDGRRDSLWAQALTPLEDPLEHAGNRTAYARYIKSRYGKRYERIFGPLPDLSDIPANASPLGTDQEKAAWFAMSERQRDEINRVFANIGKAIAAFERSIMAQPTRFDRFAHALANEGGAQANALFSPEEIHGLKLFIGKANCATCHNGPRFTDDSFHNVGVPPVEGLAPDRGRIAAIEQVQADPFNCFGAYRDGEVDACGELRFMRRSGAELVRAYKTPSLRGAAARPPYMHAGQFSTLEEVVEHYLRAPVSAEGITEQHPIRLSERERAALVAFLKTLVE